jgi:hypothetical protein
MNDLTVQASFAHDHDRLDQLLETYRRQKRVDFVKAKQAFKKMEKLPEEAYQSCCGGKHGVAQHG